jgi:hypothetical protein
MRLWQKEREEGDEEIEEEAGETDGKRGST